MYSVTSVHLEPKAAQSIWLFWPSQATNRQTPSVSTESSLMCHTLSHQEEAANFSLFPDPCDGLHFRFILRQPPPNLGRLQHSTTERTSASSPSSACHVTGKDHIHAGSLLSDLQRKPQQQKQPSPKSLITLRTFPRLGRICFW